MTTRNTNTKSLLSYIDIRNAATEKLTALGNITCANRNGDLVYPYLAGYMESMLASVIADAPPAYRKKVMAMLDDRLAIAQPSSSIANEV